MRFCLVPLRTRLRQIAENQHELERSLVEAVTYHPGMVCLPECTLTGYLHQPGDFDRFAEPIPGSHSQYLAGLAKWHGIFLCAGVVERAPGGVYNAALLFDPHGEIILHHRKIEEKPPFLTGQVFRSVVTPLGRLGVLICGDLFNGDAIALVGALDFLLVPMARCFDGTSPDLARWQREERLAYQQAARVVGTTTLIVNALADDAGVNQSFGGALVVAADGSLLAESTHGTNALLIWETGK